MLRLKFEDMPDSTCRLLCLGAHPDDIEIGCGGTIIKLLNTYKHATVYWVVFGANPVRAQEARRSADEVLRSTESRKIIIKDFRDGFFPFIGSQIKDYFEELKKEFNPDVIFTHYGHDFHQDHRIVSELTWNTFRDHLILEYEVPKYDGDLGRPNVFVHLQEDHVTTKIAGLLGCFATQASKSWFSESVFRSLLRLRGVEANAPTGFAEAFYCRKLVL